MKRKEKEIINRPSKLLKNYIKDDEQLLKENRRTIEEEFNNLSLNTFNKNYKELNSVDIRNLIEEIISSLYVIRKNIPFNFIDVVRLVLDHPEINLIDRNVG